MSRAEAYAAIKANNLKDACLKKVSKATDLVNKLKSKGIPVKAKKEVCSKEENCPECGKTEGCEKESGCKK